MKKKPRLMPGLFLLQLAYQSLSVPVRYRIASAAGAEAVRTSRSGPSPWRSSPPAIVSSAAGFVAPRPIAMSRAGRAVIGGSGGDDNRRRQGPPDFAGTFDLKFQERFLPRARVRQSASMPSQSRSAREQSPQAPLRSRRSRSRGADDGTAALHFFDPATPPDPPTRNRSLIVPRPRKNVLEAL